MEERGEAPRCAFTLSAVPAIIYAHLEAHNRSRLFISLCADAPASVMLGLFFPASTIMTLAVKDEFKRPQTFEVKVNMFNYLTTKRQRHVGWKRLTLMQIYKPEHICHFSSNNKGWSLNTLSLTSILFTRSHTESFCGESWKSQGTHARLFRDGDELSPLSP